MLAIKDLRDKVLHFVRLRGPVLPVNVAKEINMSSIIAGAILSDLVSQKLVKVSTAKIGGSPVYYTAGQEERLSMLYAGLGQKEREAYTYLKEQKILKDQEIPPAIRVALRSLKDFAIPRQVLTSDGQENLWQWYLSPEQDLALFHKKTEEPLIVAPSLPLIPTPTLTPSPQLQVRQPAAPAEKTLVADAPSFTDAVHSYLKTNTIHVLEQEVVRKNRESHLLVKIPSPVGPLDFFLIAKNKKKISNADLSLSFQKGQAKKLPVLFLSNGELTKKAKEYHEKNLKGYVLLRSLS